MSQDKLYYVLSLKWTRDILVWWRPEAKGYTSTLDQAGKYTEAEIRDKESYYNNGTTTLAVPCEIADRMSVRVVIEDVARVRHAMAEAEMAAGENRDAAATETRPR